MKFFVNLLTTIRFVGSFMLPIIKSKFSRTAFIVNIIILFLTDSVDGTLARKFKVQSLYGSIMDTVADKALGIILLFMLLGKVNYIYLVLIFEIIIAIINIFAMFKGKKTKSSYFGKTKTWLLSITIVLSYLSVSNIVNSNIIYACIIITAIMQILTIGNYIKTLKRQCEHSKLKVEIKNIEDLKYILFNTEYYLNSL